MQFLPANQALASAKDIPSTVQDAIRKECQVRSGYQIWIRNTSAHDADATTIKAVLEGPASLLTEDEIESVAEGMAEGLAEDLADQQLRGFYEDAREEVGSVTEFRRSWNEILYGPENFGDNPEEP